LDLFDIPSLPTLFSGQSEGVDFGDIFFAVYYTGTILFWFFWYVLSRKRVLLKILPIFFFFRFSFCVSLI
jgi:hypothetical protein